MRTFSKRPSELREHARSLIDVDLDPAQRAAVERPGSGAMLILGEAGHGKTTVALHRLLHLYRHAAGRFRAAVIVPHAGLERLLQPLVTRLGADVSVVAYERWARRQARRAFPDLPRRESLAVAPAVLRLKRHAGLVPLLRELSERPPGLIDDDADAPPVVTQAHAQRGDLQHLFGDGDRMRRLAAQAGESERAVAAILEHTHQQFLLRAEREYAHVDAERLVSLDRRSLDAGTAAENAESVDSEDYAVLFELDRLRALREGQRPTRPPPFDCIVLDEAQEFAPLELSLIGRSLTRQGNLIVAGDADQQTDPGAGFASWPASMRALRAHAYETVELAISYRCPGPVVTFAKALRAGHKPERSVPVHGFDSEAALAELIAHEAAIIGEEDARASFCVIARDRALARRLAAALRGKVPCKLVLDGEFSFHRGVDVTTVEHVKGLEFDYVVLADVTADAYPLTADARRALYVAVTRARYELLLAHVGEPSPWLA